MQQVAVQRHFMGNLVGWAGWLAWTLALAFFGGVFLGLLADEGSSAAPSLPEIVVRTASGEVLEVAPPITRVGERTDCAEIRGTEYRSAAEREWFFGNCGASSSSSPGGVAPIPPAVPGADVTGERWILVSLSKQQMSAMVGEKAVYSALVTTGKDGWETPAGTFAIGHRVANETMTGASIAAEEDYVLKDVLYTQYFTNDGHAIHLNYWRPDNYFGSVRSSHGCIGVRLADAEYFWRFAKHGTRVVIEV